MSTTGAMFNDLVPDEMYGLALVLSHQTLQLKRAFYTNNHLKHSMEAVVQLGYMSDTSYRLVLSLRSAKDKRIMAVNERFLVFIDQKTRQKVSIPEQIKETYGHLAKGSKKKLPVPPPKPVHAFHTEAIVCHSDTDILYHTNHASYLRFCIDCATEATANNYFSSIPGDFMACEISDVVIAYKAESFPGDHLDILTWEDDKQKNILYFLIECDGTLICSCIFTIRVSSKL